MAAVVTWADDADGTGLTATIAGGGGSETHTAYYCPISGDINDGSDWVSVTPAVGDGAIDVDCETGHFFVYVSSSSAGLSSVVYMTATSGTTSVHYRCLTSIQARIQLLELTGVDSDSVVIRKLNSTRGTDDGSGLAFPLVVISPLGAETISQNMGTNKRDDVGYPTLVSFLSADNQDLVTNQERYLKWREDVSRAFREQRLPNVGEVYKSVVQPGPIASPQAFWDAGLYHGSIVIRSLSRETRGI